jgi:hypothetical protein
MFLKVNVKSLFAAHLDMASNMLRSRFSTVEYKLRGSEEDQAAK